MRLSKNTRAEYGGYYAETWNNPTGYLGHSRYEVSKQTACADVQITPTQFDVLKRAINPPSEFPLAAFAVKGNVLRNMVAAGLVEIQPQPWGVLQETVDVVVVTEKGRAAYLSVANPNDN